MELQQGDHKRHSDLLGEEHSIRIMLILLALFCVIFLSSCVYISSHIKGIIGSHIEGIGEALMSNEERATIVNAFNVGDREALHALFSEKAQSECENLDEQMEQMFAFVPGEIVSWTLRSFSSSESVD